MATLRKSATKTRGRPFEYGNPGKPKGARHRVTRAVEVLLEGEAEALTRKVIDAALAGDMTALRFCLDRIAPASRERSVSFTAPAMRTAADVPVAIAAVIEAVSTGELTPGEGAALTSMVDRFRAAYEVAELERRVVALEAANASDANEAD